MTTAPDEISPAHTPVKAFTAEWHYSHGPYDDWGTVRDADGRMVASTRYPYAAPLDLVDHRKTKTDPYATTAHLIAAAPDMREALELLCDFAEHASSQDYNEDRVLSWIAVVTAQARAALAKARGETA